VRRYVRIMQGRVVSHPPYPDDLWRSLVWCMSDGLAPTRSCFRRFRDEWIYQLMQNARNIVSQS
jgi:hypothetical protein